MYKSKILLSAPIFLLLISCPITTFCNPFLTNRNKDNKILILGVNDQNLTNSMQFNTSSFLAELDFAFTEKRNPRFEKDILSDNGLNSFWSLWNSCPFKCVEDDLVVRVTEVLNDLDEYKIRDLPVFFQKEKEEESYEEVVLVFNSKGQIENICLSIGTPMIIKALKEANDFTDIRRKQILFDFIENFKTAYFKKDIYFIENVLKDTVIIHTGSNIKMQQKSDDSKNSNFSKEEKIYSSKTKAEYLDRLRTEFIANNYINVEFGEIEVVQHGIYPEIYGITIKQLLNSSRYKDTGYVFLMIDFRDEENPNILLSTWQPEEYTDGTKIDRDEVFNLASFGNYNR